MPLPEPILEIKVVRLLTVLVVVFCVTVTIKNQYLKTDKESSLSSSGTAAFSHRSPSWEWDILTQFSSLSDDLGEEQDEKVEDESKSADEDSGRGLEYDFYRNSCPQAEKIIQTAVRDMYRTKISVAPALVRLVFHDCFIEGCDGSVLLDPADGIESEKESPPNGDLKGFPIIDKIKAEIENVCPQIVSCADIVVLAAREGILQAGGPFYPVLTGRRDSIYSFRDTATKELPSPQADLNQTLAAFASRGFNEREAVSLLGAHSIGVVHCKFFQDRLYNFSGSNKPDPSLEAGFLLQLRSICTNTTSSNSFASSPSSSANPSSSLRKSSSSSSVENQTMPISGAPLPAQQGGLRDSLSAGREDSAVSMASDGPGVNFGLVYYRHLLQKKGIMFADQQLMAGEITKNWVMTYASRVSMFRRDFAMAMMKLSDLRVLTGSSGQIRRNCSKVVRNWQHGSN